MNKTVAIMQPYFLPYIGYFQLINHVDEFIFYDDVQYIKNGWINRNRILDNGQAVYVTIPTTKGSMDDLILEKRIVTNTRRRTNRKILKRIKYCYKSAEYFKAVFPMLEKIIQYDTADLCDFIMYSVESVNNYLNISTDLLFSSKIHNTNPEKFGQDKVIDICLARNANTYVNPVGGKDLYNKRDFLNKGIDLMFLDSKTSEYPQTADRFVSHLSIVDVLMHNSITQTQHLLMEYDLIC